VAIKFLRICHQKKREVVQVSTKKPKKEKVLVVTQAAKLKAALKKQRNNPSTGNVVGKIAEGLVSQVPIVGPLLGPMANAAASALTSADWSGSGDYKIKSNSFYDRKTGAPITKLAGTDGSTTFKYREFIGNVIASPIAGDFAHQAIRVNPGDPETFEWLHKAADGYDQWKLKGMIGLLETQTSMTAPDGGSSLGRWGCNATYNPAMQQGFTTLQQNLQADGGRHDVTTKSIEVGFECSPKKTLAPDGLYISAGAPPEGMNYAQTDPFVVNIWSEGVEEANAVLGTFSILYEIEMSKKTLTPSSTALVGDLFQGEVDISSDCYLGSEIQVCAENSLGGTAAFSANIHPPDNDNGVLYTFPVGINSGRFLVSGSTSIASSTASYFEGTWSIACTGCTPVPGALTGDVADLPPYLLDYDTGDRIGPAGQSHNTSAATADYANHWSFVVDVTAEGATIGIIWGGTNATSGPTWANLMVTSFPKTLSFNPSLLEGKRMLYKNGASINRLALGLEGATCPKDVARIVRHIRSSLSAKGVGSDDKTLLANIHLKKHRDILKQYDFGRKKEADTALEDEVKLLRAAVLAISKQGPPEPISAQPASDSDSDDDSVFLEKMLRSEQEYDRLQRRLRRLSAERDRLSREDPDLQILKGKGQKRPMSYSTTPVQPPGAKLLSTTEFMESVRMRNEQLPTTQE